MSMRDGASRFPRSELSAISSNVTRLAAVILFSDSTTRQLPPTPALLAAAPLFWAVSLGAEAQSKSRRQKAKTARAANGRQRVLRHRSVFVALLREITIAFF